MDFPIAHTGTAKKEKSRNACKHKHFRDFRGAPSEIRTPDTLIKSQVLCQLSRAAVFCIDVYGKIFWEKY